MTTVVVSSPRSSSRVVVARGRGVAWPVQAPRVPQPLRGPGLRIFVGDKVDTPLRLFPGPPCSVDPGPTALSSQTTRPMRLRQKHATPKRLMRRQPRLTRVVRAGLALRSQALLPKGPSFSFLPV